MHEEARSTKPPVIRGAASSEPGLTSLDESENLPNHPRREVLQQSARSGRAKGTTPSYSTTHSPRQKSVPHVSPWYLILSILPLPPVSSHQPISTRRIRWLRQLRRGRLTRGPGEHGQYLRIRSVVRFEARGRKNYVLLRAETELMNAIVGGEGFERARSISLRRP